MKRQIYVPFLLLENEQIPKEAILLSQNTQLGIQLGEKDKPLSDKVSVIEIPENRGIRFNKQVRSGFIQSIDYIDEYFSFKETTKLELTFPCGDKTYLKPRIKEKHLLLYRERFYDKGYYSFSISDPTCGGDGILIEGLFEVV
jgi:hypothetical protein